MKYLFASWRKLEQTLCKNSILLFLDYDGTLSPITGRPEEAFLPKETRELLIKLAKSPACRIAIISGRAVQDVKKRIGIKNIIYVGNHGLEIHGPKIKFKAMVHLKFLTILNTLKKELTKKLSPIKGTFVEDKGLSLSVHYRLVDKKYIPEVKTIFHETIIAHAVADKIRIKSGKMVFEIRPPIDWDKGKVVLWLLARQQFASKNRRVLPLYVGDDTTDEDAFCALKKKGITIFVGLPKESCAEYYLKSPQEVKRFLRQLLNYYNIQRQWKNQ